MVSSIDSNHTTRFAIVGAGGIAGAYALAFDETDEATLDAVVDVREDAAKALAEPRDARVYSSVDAMLDSALEVDAVIICTPPNTHEQITVRLLEHGLHVLCEKPLAIHSSEAEAMAEAADRTGKLITMASKFRYVPDVSEAKQLIESGAIGELILFENSFTSFVDMSERWNSTPEISGGGVLIDNGTHSLDLARFFLGPIEELQVTEGLRTQDLRVEETVAIQFKSRSGTMGSIDLSWTITKGLPSYITLHGSEGCIVLGWQGSKWKRHGEGWNEFGSGFNKVTAFQNQIENFSRAIHGEEPLLITIQDGLASVRAIEAAYESMREVPWQSVLPSTFEPRSAALNANASELSS
ncbi:MAG: Gfo/Idh/MocA family oxidoreductase [Verrucomicrobiota bacterium]